MLYERLLRTGRTDKANQFHKPSHAAEDQARDVDPMRMQPMIKPGPDEPANKRSGRKNYGELAVAGKLQQDVLLA